MKNLSVKRILIILAVGMFFYSCSAPKEASSEEFNSVIRNSRKSMINIDTNKISDLSKDFVINGSVFQQQKKYAEAILEFMDALKYDSSAAIYYAIAKCYRDMHKTNKSLYYAMMAFDRDSTYIPTLDLLADIFLLQFKASEAITVYKRIVQINPSKLNRLILASLYELNNPEEAIKQYEQVLEEGEEYNILARLSNLYKETKQKEKYIQSLEKLFEIKPNSDQNNYLLIKEYLTEKKYDKIEKMFNTLDVQIPDTEIDKYYEMVGYEFIGDTSKEVTEFIPKFAKRFDNRFIFNWRMGLMKGILYEKSKDSVEAEKVYMHVLNVADTMPDVVIQVVTFYIRQKKYVKAAEMSVKYNEKYPTEFRYPYFASIAYELNKETRKSLDYSFKALALDSNNPEIWSQIASSYDRLQKFDSSDYAFEKGLSIDPKNPTINNNYSYSLAVRNEKLDKCLQMIELALDAEPNNTSFLDTYAWVQYKLGNYEKALEYINKAFLLTEGNADLFLHLGDILLKLNEKEKALEAWRKALEKEPDNSEIKNRLNMNNK